MTQEQIENRIKVLEELARDLDEDGEDEFKHKIFVNATAGAVIDVLRHLAENPTRNIKPANTRAESRSEKFTAAFLLLAFGWLLGRVTEAIAQGSLHW